MHFRQYNIPFRLGDQEPHCNDKWSTKTEEKPTSFETPIPFICIQHERNKVANWQAHDGRDSGSEACGVVTQSSGGNLADIAPGDRTLYDKADI